MKQLSWQSHIHHGQANIGVQESLGVSRGAGTGSHQSIAHQVWRVLVRGWPLGESVRKSPGHLLICHVTRVDVQHCWQDSRTRPGAVSDRVRTAPEFFQLEFSVTLAKAWPWLYIRTIELTRTSEAVKLLTCMGAPADWVNSKLPSGQLSGWWSAASLEAWSPAQGHEIRHGTVFG